MNWVDITLFATLAAGGLLGMYIGLVRAAFLVIGVIAGVAVTAQFQGGAESWLAGYLADGVLVTILSYAMVIAATAVATMLAVGIARKLVYGMFMGWADRLGGMAAGLAVGGVVAGAVVLGMAGLSDGRYSLEEGLAGQVLSITPLDNGSISGMESKLSDSTLVSVLVNVVDIIPDKALELAPEDWQDTLRILEYRLEAMDTALR
jgi:uncharacterized membrane protein required for colicin V production